MQINTNIHNVCVIDTPQGYCVIEITDNEGGHNMLSKYYPHQTSAYAAMGRLIDKANLNTDYVECSL
jgi:hypothetical protein